MTVHRTTFAGRPDVPLRLTRRGRTALVLLLVLVAVTAFSLGRASSDASGAAPAARHTIVVAPGETLWQIARAAAPDADPRETVARIVDLNDLPSTTVRPGQRLVIPG